MHIIADKDVFINYLKACFVRTRNNEISNLKAAFENLSNTILLSKSMVERIENILANDPNLLYEFQAYIKEISDNHRLKSIDTVLGNSEQQDVIEIFEKERIYNYVFSIVDSMNQQYIKIASNCCVWTQYAAPNKNWMILSLLANRTFTVRYQNFSTDKQIKTFFENYFNLDNRTNEVYMIDSYCHLHRHNNFEILKKGYLVKVFTSSFKKQQSDIQILRSDIKSYFGSKTPVKFSSNKAILHERTIATNSFVLECNHDFAEIKRHNENWKIDVTFDHSLRNDINKKCTQYN